MTGNLLINVEDLRQALRKEELNLQKCLLAGLFSMKIKNIESHLAEIKSIIESFGGIAVGEVIQRRGVSRAKKVGGSKKLNLPLSSSTFIGKGKTLELCKIVKDSNATKIIFLNDLSKAQKQRLAELTNCDVIVIRSSVT